MKRKNLEKKVEKTVKNRMLGFKSSEKDAQLIVDVINVLANKNITIERATAILEDSLKVIKLIVEI